MHGADDLGLEYGEHSPGYGSGYGSGGSSSMLYKQQHGGRQEWSGRSTEPHMQHSHYQNPSLYHSSASSPYHVQPQTLDGGSASSSNNWRQPISPDDPRLISPRNGPLRGLPVANQQLRSSPFHKPSDSPPHARELRPAHPSYHSYGTSGNASAISTGSGHGVSSASKSAASPVLPYPATLHQRHASDSHLDLQLGRIATQASAYSLPSGVGRLDNEANTSTHTGTTAGSAPAKTPYAASRFNEPSFSPPSSGLPPSSLGSVTTPGRSWLDFPTPGTRSLLSPSHLMTTSIGTFPSSNGSLPTAWPGSAITSPHGKRKSPVDYFAGAVPVLTTQDDAKQSGDSSASGVKNSTFLDVSAATDEAHKRRRVDVEDDDDQPVDLQSAYRGSGALGAEEDEEQIDHMDEDEVGGAQDGYVLSTPLRLLAHASDAALALRQAKGDAHVANQRSTSQGAATMGLVSPPVPALPAPRKWLDSGRLPSIAAASLPSIGANSGLLPRLASVAQRRDMDRAAANHISYGRFDSTSSLLSHAPRGPSTIPPPNLASLGRSRSYTAVEAATVTRSSFHRSPERALHELPSAPFVTPVTHNERRAEVLGIHTDANGRQIEVSGAAVNGSDRSVTPSTLDPDAWEYRDGRVRSRKSFSLVASTSAGTGTTSTPDGDGVVIRQAEERTPATSVGEVVSELRKSSKYLDEESSMASKAHAESTSLAENALTVNSGFRSRLGSMDTQRRWEVVRRRPSKAGLGLLDTSLNAEEEAGSEGSSDESEKLGASHQDFFSMSIFHSKMDNDPDLDPVDMGLVQLRELEKLFDIFFARINPLLTLFDPFLHSVSHVRSRSALLTTVIAALAARLSDSGRHAKLAVILENHWRQKLLPEALLEGYKSVEISQAFLVLAIYHKPTNRLSEDRSWQYLGFAIRIATEIGVNRLTKPNDEVKDNEQVRRRVRNRNRLWISLWLTDRSLSLQTGRPHTISEDDLIFRSDLWHRENFALPEDSRLVSLIKLTRIVTDYIRAFGDIIGQQNVVMQAHLIPTSAAAIAQSQESIRSLNFCRLQATSELQRWKDIWCVEALDESSDGIQSLAIGTFLVKWRPRAVIDLHYARLHLNSIVLEAMERHKRLVVAASSARSQSTQEADNDDQEREPFTLQLEETKQMINNVALDCWETSLRMIDILLDDVPEQDLSAGSNALAINVIYGALASLRLSNASQRTDYAWADRDAILKRCKALAEALIKAGRTPEHRNGAAAPFGIYLKGIVTLWETEHVGMSDERNSHKADNIEIERQGDDSRTAAESSVRLASSATLASPTNGFKGTHQRSLTDPYRSGRPGPARRQSHEDDNAGHSKNQFEMSDNSAPVPPPLLQKHSVGDEVWGAAPSSSSRHNRASSGQHEDAVSMDRMWDYLTTYPDATSTFPMSLWQPQINSGTTSAFASAAALSALGGTAPSEVPITPDTASSAAVAAVAAADMAIKMVSVARPSPL